jgi:site-specific recombinase XerD
VEQTFAIALRASNCKETTVKNYLESLRSFAEYCRRHDFSTELSTLTRHHIRAFTAHLLSTRASATALTRYRVLHRFFAFCVEEGVLEHSPMGGLRPPKLDERLVEPYKEEEVHRLLAAHAGRDWLSLRNTAVIWFLVDTGARASEALAMRWEDVNIETGRVRLLGKGGVERIVRMGYQAQLALDRYRRACPYDAPEVWLASDGHPLTRNGLYLMIHRTGQSVGVVGANVHRLRHTMGTLFLKLGGTRQGLQEILGHKTEWMTRRYTHTVAQEVALREHERFSPGDALRGGRRKQ